MLRLPPSATALLATTLIALGACASSSLDGPTNTANTTLRYMCNDGTAFIARFGMDSVTLDFGGGAGATLAQQPTNGGPFHYSSSEFDMRGNTNQVSFSKGGGPTTSCLRGNPRDLMPR